MIRSLKNIIGYQIQAEDGEIGRVHDFLVDELRWHLRYLVVATGGWLMERRVLISPHSFGAHPRGEDKAFPVTLTREKVRNSPEAGTDAPLSRMMEARLSRYYGWPTYWYGAATAADLAPSAPLPDDALLTGEHATPDEESNHLRSLQEVRGYHIHANDGEIGHVSDLMVDKNWKVQYFILDTRNWLPGRHVLIATHWVRGLSWERQQVMIDLRRDEIESSPIYDGRDPISREYEEKIHDHYDLPKYWQDRNA